MTYVMLWAYTMGECQALHIHWHRYSFSSSSTLSFYLILSLKWMWTQWIRARFATNTNNAPKKCSYSNSSPKCRSCACTFGMETHKTRRRRCTCDKAKAETVYTPHTSKAESRKEIRSFRIYSPVLLHLMFRLRRALV